MYKLKSSKLS